MISVPLFLAIGFCAVAVLLFAALVVCARLADGTPDEPDYETGERGE